MDVNRQVKPEGGMDKEELKHMSIPFWSADASIKDFDLYGYIDAICAKFAPVKPEGNIKDIGRIIHEWRKQTNTQMLIHDQIKLREMLEAKFNAPATEPQTGIVGAKAWSILTAMEKEPEQSEVDELTRTFRDIEKKAGYMPSYQTLAQAILKAGYRRPTP